MYGYGRASGKDDRPPAGDTVYEIGSVSKVFTSLLLARAVRDGRVALSDPVQKFLPDSVTLPRRGDKSITLEHLATHTSGLPRMPDNFHPKDPANPYADYSVGQMYDFLSSCRPARDPGEGYEYSNLGVGLLGHVLALRAGKRYERLLTDRIAEPLGMTDTTITLSDDQRRRLAPGHDGDENAVANWDIPTFAGAGAIRSTADDMLRFVAAQAGLKEVDADLSAAIEMTHARRATAGPHTDVALGWHVDTRNGLVWHNGQTGGYHSYVAFDPRAKAGVVVLTNAGTGVIEPPAVALLRRMLGNPPEVPPLPPLASVDRKTLESYEGPYLLGLAGLLTVTREDDRLYAQLTGQPRFRIYPASQTSFYWRVVPAKLDFVAGEGGKVAKVVLHQNGKDLAGVRIPAPETQKGEK